MQPSCMVSPGLCIILTHVRKIPSSPLLFLGHPGNKPIKIDKS